MNVGKDPFPRDEVTGLAAFDHVEPLRSHSVVPDEPDESDEADEGSVSDEVSMSTEDSQPEAREAQSGLQVRPAGESAPQRDRVDATLPLNLAAMPHWQEALSAKDAQSQETPPAELESSDAQRASDGAALSTLDAMFDEVAGGLGWDDEDATTRVHSHPAGRAPSDASLDMEWDEDEPATEMRPFALFDAPPVAARQDDDQDWPGLNVAATEMQAHRPARGSSIRSTTPTIRVATPPLQTTLPPAQPGANALSGGRPSPFPSGQQGASAESAPVNDDRDDRDPARASAFDGLVPVPAPERAVAQSAGSWQSATDPVESAGTPERFLDALKAGHRPSLAIAAGAAVGLLALVFIVRAIVSNDVGTAVLEVSPADARVEVDGQAVSGTSSPYTVSELAPGDHEIVVTKTGYNDYRGSFPVSAGANTQLPRIELAASLRDVGFSVRSVPAGAAVWLDGERSEHVTPAKVTGIKPGIHRLALKHEGYDDYELQMFVPEATVLQLPAAELVALPEPPAEPVRVSRRTRRAASDDADSYSARRARRAETADTDRPSRAERTSYTSSAGASYGSRGRRAARGAGDEDVVGARSAAPRSASAAEGAKMGTLRLNSRPWAQVSVDGRPIGNTPQPNLQLSAGRHKVQLSNPQLGLTKTVSLTIKSGETQTQVINLAQ